VFAAAAAAGSSLLDDMDIGRKAQRHYHFTSGFREGMQAEEESHKPSTADEANKKIDTVVGALKSASEGLSSLSPVGSSAIKGVASSLMDVASLVAKAIMRRSLERRQGLYDRLTHVLEVAATKRATDIVQEFDGLSTEISRTYANVITSSGWTNESAYAFGKYAGHIVINYILRSERSDTFQAYDTWAHVLRGMILHGVDYDSSTKDPVIIKYGELAAVYFEDEKTSSAPPKPQAVAEARSAIKTGENLNPATAPYAVIASALSKTLGDGKTASHEEEEPNDDSASSLSGRVRPYINVYYFSFMHSLGDLLDVHPKASKSAGPSLRDKIKALSPDLRERLFLRVLESPNEKELRLLGFFLNKEFVRSLSLHSYDDGRQPVNRAFHRLSTRYKNREKMWNDTFSWLSRIQIMYNGKLYRNGEDFDTRRIEYFPHSKYPQFPSEVSLLNERLVELDLQDDRWLEVDPKVTAV
jgi:hypothetical protein